MGGLLLAVAVVRTVAPMLLPQPPKAVPASERRWRWVQVSLLAACALVQSLTLLSTAGARLNTILGATSAKFVRIVAGQIVLPLFLGSNRLDQVSGDRATVTLVASLITSVTLLVCLYALLRGSLELRCFLFFAGLVLMAALTFPTVEPIPYQWNAFVVPGQGLRYWYIPKLALMATLVWLLGRRRPLPIRISAAVLACIMVFAAVKYWRYPPFPDYQFATYVRVFEQLPAGSSFQFRLVPGGPWIMTLVRK